MDEPTLLSSPHVLRFIEGLIFNRPLLVERTELDFILCMLAPRLGIEPPVVSGRLRTTTVERAIPGSGRTAIIPIHGALVNRRMGSAISGGPTTYAEIREAVKAALADDSVSRLLLHIDSGGGEVAGAFDTAEMIYKARGSKPIDAFLDESGYSAAYLLASAADRIFMPRTGGAGSIGVIAMFRNQKAKDMKEGVEYEAITFGEAKADFNPHEPLGQRARATIRAQVDEIGAMFVEVVARNRNMDSETILGMQAGIFQGQSAKDIGLVDDFMTFDGAIELESVQQEEVFSMAAEDKILEMLQGIDSRLKTLEAGTVTTGLVTTVETAKPDQRYDILNACMAVEGLLGGSKKATELAAELNEGGISLAEAQTRIMERIREGQSQVELRTSVGAESTGDVNPLDKAVDALISQMPKR